MYSEPFFRRGFFAPCLNAAGVQLKDKEARGGWGVLTQSWTLTMPRRPIIIFDETVVAGTVLFLTLHF
jgi:hypothetical protein